MNSSEGIKKSIEKISISGVTIKDLLDKDFVQKLNESNININPVFLVLVPQEGNPIILSHSNVKEVEEKTIHIEAKTEAMIEQVTDIIKKMKKR